MLTCKTMLWHTWHSLTRSWYTVRIYCSISMIQRVLKVYSPCFWNCKKKNSWIRSYTSQDLVQLSSRTIQHINVVLEHLSANIPHLTICPGQTYSAPAPSLSFSSFLSGDDRHYSGDLSTRRYHSRSPKPDPSTIRDIMTRFSVMKCKWNQKRYFRYFARKHSLCKRIYRFPEQFQLVVGVIWRHSRDVCFGHVDLHEKIKN